MTNSPIVVIGAFDSKGAEYKFLLDAIAREGAQTITVNFGILGSTDRSKSTSKPPKLPARAAAI